MSEIRGDKGHQQGIMPRKYISKIGVKRRKHYKREDIQKVLDAIKGGKSYRNAEKEFNIHKNVLERHMNKNDLKIV